MHIGLQYYRPSLWETSSAIGRIAKWDGEFDVHFVPHTAINSQFLADFLVEWTNPEPNTAPKLETHEMWMMNLMDH